MGGIGTGALPQYYWMVIVSIMAGFVMAFGIGANDCANSFGSSVASKALSLGQAIIVATIFEFSGAILLGQSVTGTIRSNIIYSSYYVDQPSLLMYGMMNALIIASTWLLVFTYFEFAISTTHTIVAAIIGFSIAVEGFKSVNWKETGNIFISWIASPTLAGVIAWFFHFSVKTFVFGEGFTPEKTFSRALVAYPFVVFVGITINVAFIVLKSQKKIAEKNKIADYGVKVALPCSLVSGFVCAVVTYFFIGPWLQKRVRRQQAEFDEDVRLEQEAEAAAALKEETGSSDNNNDGEVEEDGTTPKKSVTKAGDDMDQAAATEKGSLHQAWDWFADNTYKQDLQAQSFATSKRAEEIWAASEVNDPMTERLFSYLQVFTACMTSFAHGANDVANAIAPLAAVMEIQQSGQIASKAAVPKWILAFGGVGISLGFLFFGYRTLRALGFKLTCITPSRGFCIELATALSVLIASYMSIPISSTQCLVGATVGAGVASGGLKNVQWLFLLRTSLGWVGVFLFGAFTSAGFFAYCVYSPSVVEVV